MIFIDCEVFMYDFLVTCFNGDKWYYLEDRESVIDFYNKNKNDLFIGYNIKNYDQYIIKAILLGYNPKLVNDFIIKEGKAGWELTSEFKDIELNIYDCIVFSKSLKQLESYLGVDIHESDVNFDLNRPLNEVEKCLNRKYCHDDVYNTVLVFQHTIDDFKSHLGLCKLANEPLSSMSKTKAQLSAKILKAKPLPQRLLQQEWEFEYNQCVKDYDYKHKDVLKFFDSLRETKDPKSKYEVNLYGVPHIFGLGGLHGSIDNYTYKDNGTKMLVHADVGSYYPSQIIKWDLLSRAVPNPKLYSDLRDLRLKYKHEKNPLQAPLKLVLNSTYGVQLACKQLDNGDYKTMSSMADPKKAREICVNGQLMLLQLIEDVMNVIPTARVPNTNTDGVIFEIDKNDFNKLDKCVKDWEKRSRMTMEYDYITYMIQSDVNNYVCVFENGQIERKGGAVKASKPCDYDLPILANAVVEYFIHGITPEEYIMKENKLMPFMKTYKLSSAYNHALYGDEKQQGKIFRVFASRSRKDKCLYKQKEGKNKEKFAGCPEHCKIVNDDIREMTVPNWLNRNWYIEMAWKRIQRFEGK